MHGRSVWRTPAVCRASARRCPRRQARSAPVALIAHCRDGARHRAHRAGRASRRRAHFLIRELVNARLAWVVASDERRPRPSGLEPASASRSAKQWPGSVYQPQLGEHLSRTIRTGTCCAYFPTLVPPPGGGSDSYRGRRRFDWEAAIALTSMRRWPVERHGPRPPHAVGYHRKGIGDRHVPYLLSFDLLVRRRPLSRADASRGVLLRPNGPEGRLGELLSQPELARYFQQRQGRPLSWTPRHTEVSIRFPCCDLPLKRQLVRGLFGERLQLKDDRL